LQIKSS